MTTLFTEFTNSFGNNKMPTRRLITLKLRRVISGAITRLNSGVVDWRMWWYVTQ